MISAVQSDKFTTFVCSKGKSEYIQVRSAALCAVVGAARALRACGVAAACRPPLPLLRALQQSQPCPTPPHPHLVTYLTRPSADSVGDPGPAGAADPSARLACAPDLHLSRHAYACGAQDGPHRAGLPVHHTAAGGSRAWAMGMAGAQRGGRAGHARAASPLGATLQSPCPWPPTLPTPHPARLQVPTQLAAPVMCLDDSPEAYAPGHEGNIMYLAEYRPSDLLYTDSGARARGADVLSITFRGGGGYVGGFCLCD